MASALRHSLRRLEPILASGTARTLFGVLILALAAWLIRYELKGAPLQAILAALRATPLWAVGLSILLAALSYVCLAVTEWSALKLVGKPLSVRVAAGASFSANALSLAAGFGLASGVAVRLRIYASSGLSAGRVGRLVLILSAATFLSGVVGLGLAVLSGPVAVASALGWPVWAAVLLGALMLAPGALWFRVLRGKPRARRLRLDARGRAVALLAGLGDWLFSGAALFVLASHDVAALPPFMAVFLAGSLIASIVGTPGGVGVLDAAILGMRAQERVHETAAALILYRAIYLLGPLLISATIMVARQAARSLSATAASRRKPGDRP